MRRLILCAGVLLGSLMGGAAERPRDPWVLRCVLDDNPRSVVLAMAPDLWASYDAGRCRFSKVWRGDLKLDGSVWTGAHGPQPESVGETLVTGPLTEQWVVNTPTGEIPVTPVWRGYRFEGDAVILQFELQGARSVRIRIDERPELEAMDDGRVRFTRTFSLFDVPKGYLVDAKIKAMAPGDAPIALSQDGESLAEEAAGQQFHMLRLVEDDEVTIVSILPDPEASR